MAKRKIPLQGKGRRFRADLWLDEKITGRTLDALRRQGVRFPETVNPRKTVREILREPMRHLLSLKKAEQLARASEMLKAVDLDDSVLDKRPPQLSGGQLQRVCLARALAVEPKLLILDEAVSNLDLVLQAGVIRLLKKLQQQFGTACLFITHDLRLVERFCQRVMVMDNGQIVETQVVGDKLTFSSDAGRVLQNAVLPAYPVRRRATEKV